MTGSGPASSDQSSGFIAPWPADPRAGQAVGRCEAQQMVVRAAATVDGLGVQQRAYLAHGIGKLAELLAAHGDRAASGPVQAEYQPYHGRLARPVRAEDLVILPCSTVKVSWSTASLSLYRLVSPRALIITSLLPGRG